MSKRTTTDEHQRERNRAKMAAYRARNVEKARAQSREAVRRMRERMKAEGRTRPIESKRLLAQQIRAQSQETKPKPEPKPKVVKRVIAKSVNRIALLRERFMAFRNKDKI